MDLFDGLSDLFKPPDESTPALLDADCKHSVLGKSETAHVNCVVIKSVFVVLHMLAV